MNNSEETEEIKKNIPPLPLPTARIAGLAHCKPISDGRHGDT